VDAFAKKAGFLRVGHVTEYDIALSFAGQDRAFARSLNDYLEDANLSVFFDEPEAARILGEDLPAFFGPNFASVIESAWRAVVAPSGHRVGCGASIGDGEGSQRPP
jgi:hypothetical protein